MNLKNLIWKGLGVLLVLYTLIAGFLGPVPHLPILNESIRNFYFHVPMWFVMLILFTVGVIYSIKYLNKQKIKDDIIAVEFVNAGIMFGVLGLLTGSLWAKFTWGEWWSNDPKQNGSAIALLLYFAYLILRNSIREPQLKAKVAGVFNIFAYSALIPLIFILPRMTDSLHPGAGGNPGFNAYDLDYNMRLIFYPAVIGWALIGVWIANLSIRIKSIRQQKLESEGF